MTAEPNRSGGPSPTADESAALLERFHDELRQRNVNALFWSTCIFDAAYVGWTVFDHLLEPEHAKAFLAIRLTVALFGTVVAVAVRRSRSQRYTWEAFWAWLFVCGAGIAAMLPHVDHSFTSYILGFTLILYGAGLLPFWRPAWAASNVFAILATAPLAYLVWPEPLPTEDLVTGLFFVATGAGATLVMATLKYSFARSDFMNRAALATTSSKLEQALRRLEAHDRMKSRFFANISHELRSPLTLILAPVQTMLVQEDSASARRDLRTVEQNAERLLRLIDDLLDLSKLDAGGLRLELSVFDLGALLKANVERCRPAASSRGQQLRVALPESLPPVLGDEHRMETVISNLLGNAIKYAEPGGLIQARIIQVEGALRVEVQDDGPGIPPDEVEQVFDRFFQSSRAQERAVGGVGIGLALAKELVELHGGGIELQSTLGEGSTFAFTVQLGRDHIRPEVIDRRRGIAERRTTQRPGATPGRRASDLPPPVPLTVPNSKSAAPLELPTERPLRLELGRRPRIVLAEDQEDLRRFVAELLSPDFDVIEAEDGDRAWELVQSERPDLVLSDVMMPGRSGSALCRDIKSDPRLHGIPVILLTARAGSEATLSAYAVGADDFIAKPFHPRVLVARVGAQLKLRALSAELAQRERLAAVGTLTAGILHDVRNPVNALLSASRTLATGEVPQAVQDRLLQVLQDAAQRIHLLTMTLDTHIRPAEAGGPALCDPRQGMDATLRLLDHRLGQVGVHCDYRGQGEVRIAAGPINQVFVNLLDNAIKAGASQVWIRIDTQQDPARVTVSDNGAGIRPEALDRIFDPFFTTAPAGEGSGLGLYLSKAIVDQAGGQMSVRQREGGGTTFIIELPKESGPAKRRDAETA